MEIRMKTLSSGPNGTRHPGETCIVSPEEGEMLVAGGFAEALQKPPEVRDMFPAEQKPPEEASADEAAELEAELLTAKKRKK